MHVLAYFGLTLTANQEEAEELVDALVTDRVGSGAEVVSWIESHLASIKLESAMKTERHNTNPNGKNGKPFSLAPYSFEDALQKILKATPEPKLEVKPKTQPASKKATKKR